MGSQLSTAQGFRVLPGPGLRASFGVFVGLVFGLGFKGFRVSGVEFGRVESFRVEVSVIGDYRHHAARKAWEERAERKRESERERERRDDKKHKS